MRYILTLLAFLFSLSFAQTYPKPVGYVNDFAQLLSSAERKGLNEEVKLFEKKTSVELAVITLTTINGQDPQTYAAMIGDYWGVGKEYNNNGVVFLIVRKDRKMFIQSGSGSRKIMSDAVIQSIRTGIIAPRTKAGDWAGGVIEGTRAIMRQFPGGATIPTIPTTLVSAKPKPVPTPQVTQKQSYTPTLNDPQIKTLDQVAQEEKDQSSQRLGGVLLALFAALVLVGWLLWRRYSTHKHERIAKIIDLRDSLNDILEQMRSIITSYEGISNIYKTQFNTFFTQAKSYRGLDIDSIGVDWSNVEGKISELLYNSSRLLDALQFETKFTKKIQHKEPQTEYVKAPEKEHEKPQVPKQRQKPTPPVPLEPSPQRRDDGDYHAGQTAGATVVVIQQNAADIDYQRQQDELRRQQQHADEINREKRRLEQEAADRKRRQEEEDQRRSDDDRRRRDEESSSSSSSSYSSSSSDFSGGSTSDSGSGGSGGDI